MQLNSANVTGREVTEIQDKKFEVKDSENYAKKWANIKDFVSQLKWFNLILLITLHAVFVWAVIAFPWLERKRLILWNLILGHISGFGVGAGAHRLWSHRAYKAKLPLRIILMMCYTTAGHNPLFYWVRDHRVHHRFTDTDADPHNSKRGFFFSHVGWLFVKKHPDVIKKGKEVDMSDLWEDPVIRFSMKYFIPLTLTLGFILPSIIPPLVWGQDWKWSIISNVIIRYVIVLNFTWLVNSAAHMWGTKPFDTSISPTDNRFVSYAALGEGWHNYHHTFPWDYKASEFHYAGHNVSTFAINQFAKTGWAYDLKSASPELIKKVSLKGGDGSRYVWGEEVPESAEQHKRT